MTPMTDSARDGEGRASAELELAHAEEFFKAFRRATPSAPNWYQLIDMAVSVLFADYIERLKARAALLQESEANGPTPSQPGERE